MISYMVIRRNSKLGPETTYISSGIQDTRQVPDKNPPMAINHGGWLLERIKFWSGKLGHKIVVRQCRGQGGTRRYLVSHSGRSEQ